MKRAVVGSLILLGLGLVLRGRSAVVEESSIRSKSAESVDDLTLDQLFAGVVPENVKRTWKPNKEKKE